MCTSIENSFFIPLFLLFQGEFDCGNVTLFELFLGLIRKFLPWNLLNLLAAVGFFSFLVHSVDSLMLSASRLSLSSFSSKIQL